RQVFAQVARDEFNRRKRAGALMTHDDELTRLLNTLVDRAGGPRAAAQLRERYRVVLIDEFQDTDPVQWEIVRRVFDHEGISLVLIGDPKQAIYGFRGADVYAYLDAAAVAGRRATLSVNHRSDQGLLDGLDALFAGARLGHPDIQYRHVRAASDGRASRLRDAPVAAPLRFRVLSGSSPLLQLTPSGYPNAGSARELIARDLAQDVVALLDSGATLERVDRHGHIAGATAVAPGDIAVLVYSHRQAALIRDHLSAVQVPVVINGAGSVFGTAAADQWRVLLEALERPSSALRARAAALTPFLGWDATRLAEAGEAELEQLHQRLYAWARVLREHGVATLTATIMAQARLPERVLARVDGERQMTDLQHISQVLHGAASAEQLGIAALTGWLRQRIAAALEEGSNEELTRRLDSDADAVQVLTVHRSKGLEFPIVYCPFLMDPRKRDFELGPVYFHDADAGNMRAVDVGLEGAGYKRHHHQHCLEERGEDLRVAYVALTRARHQATVWWAGTWDSKNSPLARILFDRDAEGNISWEGKGIADDATARARLDQIAAAAPHAISIEPAEPSGLPRVWSGEPVVDAELVAARFDRALDTHWRRTSYTALTAAAHEAAGIGSEPEEYTLRDEPPGPEDTLASTELPLSAMASGPRLGTVIHRVLEQAEFDASDLEGELAGLLAAQTALRPAVLGASAEAVAAGLALALRTPLDMPSGAVALAAVRRQDRLDELTFELPLTGDATLVAVAELLGRWLSDDDPLAGYAARLGDPGLSAVLRGYLTGSIDLVL
ncbi:MAG TPA: UvrD-helicase domain-containing protein, partial [Solirubrobacteraceae bacterium]|nr:UvrD-helicase domain-containing protein [Solirubrobacteraceae bacterium]